jgi:hypothetical protein
MLKFLEGIKKAPLVNRDAFRIYSIGKSTYQIYFAFPEYRFQEIKTPNFPSPDIQQVGISFVLKLFLIKAFSKKWLAK